MKKLSLILVVMLALAGTAIAEHDHNISFLEFKVLSHPDDITKIQLVNNKNIGDPRWWKTMDDYKRSLKKWMTDGNKRKQNWTTNHAIIAVHYKYCHHHPTQYLYYGTYNPEIWSVRKGKLSRKIGTGWESNYWRHVGDGTAWAFWAVKKSDIDTLGQFTFFITTFEDTETELYRKNSYYGAGRIFSRTFTYVSETRAIKHKIGRAASWDDQIIIAVKSYSINQDTKINDPKLAMSHKLRISIYFKKDVGLGETSALFYVKIDPILYARYIHARWKGEADAIQIPLGKTAILTFDVPPGYFSAPIRELEVDVWRDYVYKGMTRRLTTGDAHLYPKLTMTPTVVIE